MTGDPGLWTLTPLASWVLGGAIGLLLLFSRPLLRRIFSERDEKRFRGRLNLFRLACLLALAILAVRALAHPAAGSLWFTRLLGVFLLIYVSYLLFYLASRLILRRYGRERQRDDETVYVETYASRLLTIVAGILIAVVALVAIIRVLGFTSWLEAGGVLGVLGVLFALTQAAWVPDLVSGLVILNSRLAEEGDVVQLDKDKDDLLMVFRTRVFFTEFLHLGSNHRLLIQNSRLRGMTVQNLTRFASAKGLREGVFVKVGYEVTEAQVRALFEQVMAEALADADIPVEEKYEAEIRPVNGGDYGVEWACFYYTKDARALLRTRQLMLGLTLKAAREQGLSLATPLLVHHPVERPESGGAAAGTP